jgi:hypothetical protein
MQFIKSIKLTEDTAIQSNESNSWGFTQSSWIKTFHDSGVNIIRTDLNERIVLIKIESFFPTWKRSNLEHYMTQHRNNQIH